MVRNTAKMVRNTAKMVRNAAMMVWNAATMVWNSTRLNWQHSGILPYETGSVLDHYLNGQEYCHMKLAVFGTIISMVRNTAIRKWLYSGPILWWSGILPYEPGSPLFWWSGTLPYEICSILDDLVCYFCMGRNTAIRKWQYSGPLYWWSGILQSKTGSRPIY